MTDEERQELCDKLRSGSIRWLMKAADELERLASELKREEAESEHYVRLAFVDAGANPAVTWQREAERLAKRVAELERECGRFENELFKARAALAESDVEPVNGVLEASLPGIDDQPPPRHDASAGHGHSLIKGDRGGISWGGSFYVEGNRESIDAVRAAHDAQERCRHLDKMIAEKQLVRPSASAGLIEAAEWHEELAKEKLKQAQQVPEAKKRRFLDISFFHDECASALRARATDRSGK